MAALSRALFELEQTLRSASESFHFGFIAEQVSKESGLALRLTVSGQGQELECLAVVTTTCFVLSRSLDWLNDYRAEDERMIQEASSWPIVLVHRGICQISLIFPCISGGQVEATNRML